MALNDLSPKERKRILSEFDDEIAEGLSGCEGPHRRWSEAQKYTASGMQWQKGDIEKLRRRKMPPVELNDVFKVVNAISNKELVERYEPKILGREGADGGIADVANELCRWQRQQSNSEHYESMGFRSAVFCGYGAVNKYFDPTADDGRGLIKDRDIPLIELLWPSRCRDINLLDRDWIICGRWVSAAKAEARYGSASAAVRRKFKSIRTERDRMLNSKGEDYPENPAGKFAKRGKSSGQGFGWEAVNSQGWVSAAHTEVFVAEREWAEVEYVWRAKVPARFYDWYAFVVGRQPMTFEQPPDEEGNPTAPFVLYPENYDRMDAEQQAQIIGEALAETNEVEFSTRKELNQFLDEWLQSIGTEFIQFKESGKTVIKYAVRIDDELVDYGTRPWGWSYHVITGFPKETEEGMEYYGVVDMMKSPQDLKNAMISAMVARYKADPKGAFVFSKSVGNIQEIADKMASPDAIIQLDDQVVANLEQHMKQFPAAQFTAMGGELLAIFTNSVLTQVGVDPISMNAQTDLRRVSGNVVQSAQAAANVIVALLFDSMRLFRKMYGKCNIRFLHYLYGYDDVVRIVGEEKVADLESIGDATWDEILLYDVVIDEVPSTATEQMEQVEALTATGTINLFYQNGDLSFENFVKHFLPRLSSSAKRDLLQGKTMKDQLIQMQDQLMKEQETKKALYQELSKIPGGVELMAQIDAQTKQNEMSQQLFNTPPGGGQ